MPATVVSSLSCGERLNAGKLLHPCLDISLAHVDEVSIQQKQIFGVCGIQFIFVAIICCVH